MTVSYICRDCRRPVTQFAAMVAPEHGRCLICHFLATTIPDPTEREKLRRELIDGDPT
jgi:hypothetical protein